VLAAGLRKTPGGRLKFAQPAAMTVSKGGQAHGLHFAIPGRDRTISDIDNVCLWLAIPERSSDNQLVSQLFGVTPMTAKSYSTLRLTFLIPVAVAAAPAWYWQDQGPSHERMLPAVGDRSRCA
jgi:hypothetical protein